MSWRGLGQGGLGRKQSEDASEGEEANWRRALHVMVGRFVVVQRYRQRIGLSSLDYLLVTTVSFASGILARTLTDIVFLGTPFAVGCDLRKAPL
jgi:hypothetical protein